MLLNGTSDHTKYVIDAGTYATSLLLWFLHSLFPYSSIYFIMSSHHTLSASSRQFSIRISCHTPPALSSPFLIIYSILLVTLLCLLFSSLYKLLCLIVPHISKKIPLLSFLSFPTSFISLFSSSRCRPYLYSVAHVAQWGCQGTSCLGFGKCCR